MPTGVEGIEGLALPIAAGPLAIGVTGNDLVGRPVIVGLPTLPGTARPGTARPGVGLLP